MLTLHQELTEKVGSHNEKSESSAPRSFCDLLTRDEAGRALDSTPDSHHFRVCDV